jgi:transcriptional regulator with XRE-family HTH domain
MSSEGGGLEEIAMAANLLPNLINSNFFSTFVIEWQKRGYFIFPRLQWPHGDLRGSMKSRSLIASTPERTTAKPGSMLKKIRIQKGWTLKEVSRRTGYPVSTLSKIENDRVSLTYDKLTRISAGLEVDFSRLLGAQDAAIETVPDAAGLHGRRSVARAGEGRSIESKNYLHVYPATDLLNKRLIPIVVEIRARSLKEFGELVRHSGEEYIYVLEGEIEVHTSAYAPVRLKTGDSIYLDSSMGHAYIAFSGNPCRVLGVCSGTESQMIAAVGGAPAVPAEPAPAAVKRTPRRRTA